MIASRTALNGQQHERISLQHFALKNGVARVQRESGAFQPPILSCNDDLAYAICQRARWRCEVCQTTHGSYIMCDYGFSRVVLSVDCQARRPRALCQRCRLNETQEVAALPLLPGRKSKLSRLHVELVPLKPLLPAQNVAWML